MAQKIGDFYASYVSADAESAAADASAKAAIENADRLLVVKDAAADNLATALASRRSPERKVLIRDGHEAFKILVPTPGTPPGFRVDDLDTEDTEVGGDAFAAPRGFARFRQ